MSNFLSPGDHKVNRVWRRESSTHPRHHRPCPQPPGWTPPGHAHWPLPTQHMELKDKQRQGHTAGGEQPHARTTQSPRQEGEAGPGRSAWGRGDDERATPGTEGRQKGGMSLHLRDSRERTHGGRGQAPGDRGPPPRSSRERGEQRRSYKGTCSSRLLSGSGELQRRERRSAEPRALSCCRLGSGRPPERASSAGPRASSWGAPEGRKGRRGRGGNARCEDVPCPSRGTWSLAEPGAEGLTLGVGGFGPGGCGGARASRGTGVSGQKEAVGRIGEQQRCREKGGGETRGRDETQG